MCPHNSTIRIGLNMFINKSNRYKININIIYMITFLFLNEFELNFIGAKHEKTVYIFMFGADVLYHAF